MYLKDISEMLKNMQNKNFSTSKDEGVYSPKRKFSGENSGCSSQSKIFQTTHRFWQDLEGGENSDSFCENTLERRALSDDTTLESEGLNIFADYYV